MLKLAFSMFIISFVSACVTQPVRYEYAEVQQNNIVKACGFDDIELAKKYAVTQYLEENGVFVKSNNNSICNSNGCMQEDEIRSFAKNSLTISLINRNNKEDCRYFKITKNKGKSFIEATGNQEGKFDISSESDTNFISINVLNSKDPVLAKMNGKPVLLNNGQYIHIKGKKTLKFVIDEFEYETKSFTIKTSDKAEKIVKNITLVPKKISVSESDLKYGFKIVKSKECFLGKSICGTQDIIINDEPFDTRMLRNLNEDNFRKKYLIFNDINLYKTTKLNIKARRNSDNKLIVNINPSSRRTGEFKKQAEYLANIYDWMLVSKFNYHSNNTDDYSMRADPGTDPFVHMYLIVEAYDGLGRYIGESKIQIPVFTRYFKPSHDHWAGKLDRIVFGNVFNDDWSLRYRIELKLSPSGCESNIGKSCERYEILQLAYPQMKRDLIKYFPKER